MVYFWLGVFCLSIGLFIERKNAAKKICKYYDALFSEYKQECQLIASQTIYGNENWLLDGIVQPGDKAYLIVGDNHQFDIYPLNNGKNLNIPKRQYQFLIQEFQNEQTIYRIVGTTISIYHRLDEPFNNCIFLVKRAGIGQWPSKL